MILLRDLNSHRHLWHGNETPKFHRLRIRYRHLLRAHRPTPAFRRRERTQPRVFARDAMPDGRASTLRPDGANQRCTGKFTAARTVCLMARRRLREKARASCRSGSETIRRSTTATVQGISPFCYDGRILGSCAIGCQPIFHDKSITSSSSTRNDDTAERRSRLVRLCT
jgi:hypothetical protein